MKARSRAKSGMTWRSRVEPSVIGPSVIPGWRAAPHPESRKCKWENGVAMEKVPCVYILANRRNGTLYVGVTSNLVQRVWQHREGCVDGFTKRYGVHRLVWYERHDDMESAIVREKRIKKWRRTWKLELIERANPEWRDLYPEIVR